MAAAEAPSEIILRVEGIGKTFRKPFSGKRVEAVKGISFDVARGEIFGFLGPNGAGKTTTIKMLTGLIAPTKGSATLLGMPIPSPEAMGRVGFLPENPYVYPYLTPREFVSMCGRLNGMSGASLAERVVKSVDRVGIGYAIDRPVRALSKGMLQRTGLAAALVHDPEMLMLDEPMSGLDPVGRKEVRDIILEERASGRTVFFSSHILSDVEMLCDRVCILKQGEVVVSGAIRDLVKTATEKQEITLVSPPADFEARLPAEAVARRAGALLAIDVDTREMCSRVLTLALEANVAIESVQPKRETLEALFVARAL